MVQAYVLVRTEVGRSDEVARQIAALGGVELAVAVTGPYDVIVQVRVRGVEDLGTLVLDGLQHIAGILRTVTCPVIRPVVDPEA